MAAPGCPLPCRRASPCRRAAAYMRCALPHRDFAGASMLLARGCPLPAPRNARPSFGGAYTADADARLTLTLLNALTDRNPCRICSENLRFSGSEQAFEGSKTAVLESGSSVPPPILTQNPPFSPCFSPFPTAFFPVSNGVFRRQVAIFRGRSDYIEGQKWSLRGTKVITSDRKSLKNSQRCLTFSLGRGGFFRPEPSFSGLSDSKTRVFRAFS